MVKSLVSIGVALSLLLGAAFFEWYYLNTQFSAFGEELTSLYRKTEEETANAEDAKAVQASWENRKEHLHVWIPHNDIVRIDDYLSETVRFVGEKEYSLALSKLEILIHLTKCLPDTYRPGIENVF
ncbi:MAG: DUF4363 family protein [Candidatus Gallimonas sp.]